MINFEDVTLEKIVPQALKNEEEVKALSYALKIQMDKLLRQAEKLDFWTDLENASEMILNAMGFELNIPAWSLKLKREQKINMIKNSMIQKRTLGSLEMLASFLTIRLGNYVEIKEWFKTGGAPGTFKILTQNAGTNDEDVEEVKKIAKKVSRLSQHISAVTINLINQSDLKVAGIVRAGTYETLFCNEKN